MEKQARARLEAVGIDVEGALERFMGNELLLERFLKKFLEDTNYAKLKEALDTGDREGAITASHTLKGVCGNLSMTELFACLTQQVQLLRDGDEAGAAALMPAISRSYDVVCQVIRENLS